MRVYIDGACVPNPGVGGWACVFVPTDGGYWVESGSDPSTTNNRMELEALCMALEFAKAGDTVYSDSTYVVDGYNRWMHSWAKRGWPRHKLNLDIWRRLYDLKRRNPQVNVTWIRGHNGNEWNELADAIAQNQCLLDNTAK